MAQQECTKNGLRDVVSYVRANYDLLAELADEVGDDGEFRYSDVPDHFQPRIEKWKHEGIITAVRTDGGANRHGGATRKVWTVSEQVVEWIRDYEPRSAEAPCGHHGFTNLGNGHFSCPHDWCDERFGSMALSRALNR